MSLSRHERAFDAWVGGKLLPHLEAKRGRYSELARHLEVSRQRVHRWLKCQYSVIPGWAAVAMNIWFNEQVRRGVVTPQTDKPVIPRRDLPVVAPQAEKTFDFMEYVPRSGDIAPV